MEHPEAGLTTDLRLIMGLGGELTAVVVETDDVSTSLPLTIGLSGELVEVEEAVPAKVSQRSLLVASHSPVAWWGFNSAAENPNFGQDLIGNHDLAHYYGPVGSESGGPVPGDSPPQGSADGYVTYDGVDDYSFPANDADLQLHSDCSFEVWVYPTDGSSSNNQHIFSIRNPTASPTATRGLYEMHWRSDDRKFVFSTGLGSTVTTDNNRPLYWHHVVATVEWTGTTVDLKLYLNGAWVDVASLAELPVEIERNFIIGRRDFLDTTQLFQGHISEMAVYPKVLTDAEIAALYAATYEES